MTNRLNLIGQLTNVVDSAGMSVTNWFNNQGLMVTVSNAFGRVQATLYDTLDRATNNVDANGVIIKFNLRCFGSDSHRSYPDGGVESFGYAMNVAGLTSYTEPIESGNALYV